MEWIPTISTVSIVISAILMFIGWRKIKNNHQQAHARFMLSTALFALIFFIFYMLHTTLQGSTSFGGPEALEIYYTIFLIFHIFLATLGAVLLVIQIVSGLRGKFSLHRKMGPFVFGVWEFAAITGVMVYLMLYIIFPQGDSTSLLDAIFAG